MKIDIQFAASEEQRADILAKSFAATSFKYHRQFSVNLPVEKK